MDYYIPQLQMIFSRFTRIAQSCPVLQAVKDFFTATELQRPLLSAGVLRVVTRPAALNLKMLWCLTNWTNRRDDMTAPVL